MRTATVSRSTAFLAICSLAAHLPCLAIARSLAHFGSSLDPMSEDSGGLEEPVLPAAEPPTDAPLEQPVLPLAQPPTEAPKQGTSPVESSTRSPSLLGRLWDNWNGLPSSDGAQGPGATLLAVFALGTSLIFSARWIWQRNRPSLEAFEEVQEIVLQRKLFDDASMGNTFFDDASMGTILHHVRHVFVDPMHNSKHLKMACQLTLCVTAILGMSYMVLQYVDFSYIIIGCFAAVAVVYDRQVNQVMQEGQKKCGIDLIA